MGTGAQITELAVVGTGTPAGPSSETKTMGARTLETWIATVAMDLGVPNNGNSNRGHYYGY